ncbi:MAG: beta-galactosidase trimerization domain-containing protein [Tidjanibacter sp.]|nr:beta-galactosidase trimerization domain-containing protein [Tidjanibacter sp.]
MKKIYALLVVLSATTLLNAQSSNHPLLGAQIFIEPGQTPEQIDSYFELMEQNGLEVGRVRLFGSHIIGSDGKYDYSLYDAAFRSAERHNIKLFATLFPTTDELTDVGGFKFPRSERHLEEIDNYIRTTVNHFKTYPALYCWVLQNEPGLGSTINPQGTELSRKKYEEYMAGNPKIQRNGYLAADFTNEGFLRYYTDWYLKHISTIVEECDPQHGRHINPHQILSTLPEYDFKSYEQYLSSLGVSMHMSWHFDYFDREEYPLGVCIMSDVIGSAAGRNPWWITEMQGGAVTASGKKVVCPTAQEIEQNVWLGIASGTEGVIFWTLNSRRAVQEAGEWALLNYLGQPSDRLTTLSKISKSIQNNIDFFESAKPEKDNVWLLYNKESLWIQAQNAAISNDHIEGRGKSAVMKSLVSAYNSISAWGISPHIADIDSFNFERSTETTVVLCNLIALTAGQIEELSGFVASGGRLIVTGMSGYYDEKMRCRMMSEDPLWSLLGGRIKEFKVGEPYFEMDYKEGEITNHYWTGLIEAEAETTVLARYQNDTAAIGHKYGNGETFWFPSMIELGGWHHDNNGLNNFYGSVCSQERGIAKVEPIVPNDKLIIRTLRNGSERMTVVVNKNPYPATVSLNAADGIMPVFGTAKYSKRGATIELGSEECFVFKWQSPK